MSKVEKELTEGVSALIEELNAPVPLADADVEMIRGLIARQAALEKRQDAMELVAGDLRERLSKLEGKK